MCFGRKSVQTLRFNPRDTNFATNLTTKNHARHYIKHRYQDHSHDISYATQRKAKGGVTNPFPNKLYKMLNDVEKCGLEHIVSWAPHGRCFLVHKSDEFVDKILPKYFSQSKIGSFQRQLNLYSFTRLTQGPDRGGYYHELFLRGKTHLCDKMQRTKVKGTKIRGCSNPDSEPNFYLMDPIVPDDEVKQNMETSLVYSSRKSDKDQIAEFEGKTFHLLDERDINIEDIMIGEMDLDNGSTFTPDVTPSCSMINHVDSAVVSDSSSVDSSSNSSNDDDSIAFMENIDLERLEFICNDTILGDDEKIENILSNIVCV